MITAAASSAFLGCAADVSDAASSSQRDDAENEPAEVATVGQALTVPLTLGKFDFCAAVNELGKHINSLLPTSNVVVNDLRCESDKTNNLYYNGTELSSGTLSDLLMLPYVTTGAYYCALSEANGASVSAQSGWFGMSSRFDVTRASPATTAGNFPEIQARRVGTVTLFGVPFKTHVQDMVFKFPFEWGRNSTPPFYGEYMSVLSDSNWWNVDVTATIPVGPYLIKVRPQMHQRIGQGSQTNNAIQFSPEVQSDTTTTRMNKLDPAFDYAAWDACRTNPKCLQPRSAVSNDLLMIQHNFGDCLGANVGNFTDNSLPYYSTLGGAGRTGCYYASGKPDFIFLDNLKNWFHFGKPSAANGAFADANEPKHNIAVANVDSNYGSGLGMKDASFTAGVNVSGSFDFGFVKMSLSTTASMAARDGFAVRQTHSIGVDPGSSNTVRVWTDLNAQTKTDLKIHVDLSFPGLPIPDMHPEFTIPTGDTGNVETATVPSSMTYYDRPVNDGTSGPRGFQSYTVRGVNKSNPDQARLGCFLASAPTVRSVEEPQDPAQSVIGLANGAVNLVHPCFVKTCTDSFHQSNLRWDFATHSLVPDGTKSFCEICASMQMNLCTTAADLDANGQPQFDPITHVQKTKEVVIMANVTPQAPLGSAVFMKAGLIPAAPGHSCLTH